jgi:hypothetical protein
VNDPPHWVSPSAQLVAQEDKAMVVPGLLVQDADARSPLTQASLVCSVQLRVAHGTIKLSSSLGLRFHVDSVSEESARLNPSAGVEIDVSGAATSQFWGDEDERREDDSGAPPQTRWRSVAFSGTLEAVNRALHLLSFLSAPDWNSQEQGGEDSLYLTANDMGSSGAGGGKSAALTLGIAVLPVNDAPVVTAPAELLTVLEDGELHVSGVHVADVDMRLGDEDMVAPGAGFVEVTLQATHGYIALEKAQPVGLVLVSGSGDGSSAFVKFRALLGASNNGE